MIILLIFNAMKSAVYVMKKKNLSRTRDRKFSCRFNLATKISIREKNVRGCKVVSRFYHVKTTGKRWFLEGEGIEV